MTGISKQLYNRIYKNQGARRSSKKPPVEPLLYVPSNSATMLKRDLAAAGIPLIGFAWAAEVFQVRLKSNQYTNAQQDL